MRRQDVYGSYNHQYSPHQQQYSSYHHPHQTNPTNTQSHSVNAGFIGNSVSATMLPGHELHISR